MRSSREKTIDKSLVLLNLRNSFVDSKTKLQKLIFLCENELINRRVLAFNYTFFRYRHGPYSRQLAEDRKELGRTGLTSGDSLSPRGRHLADIFREVLKAYPANEETIGVIENTARTYGRYSGSRLKQHVYDMTVFCYDLGKRMRVEDIPKGKDIFAPQEMQDMFREPIQIDDDDLESMELSLQMTEADLAAMRRPASEDFEKTFLSVCP